MASSFTLVAARRERSRIFFCLSPFYMPMIDYPFQFMRPLCLFFPVNLLLATGFFARGPFTSSDAMTWLGGSQTHLALRIWGLEDDRGRPTGGAAKWILANPCPRRPSRI